MKMSPYNIPWKGDIFLYRNKAKALELLKKKINGEIKITYKEIERLTSYTKRQLIRLSKEVEKRDIDSILIHGNTGRKPSITASDQEVKYIIEFKKKYLVISISQFMDIYHEDVIFNSKMINEIKQHGLKLRSYSFFKQLYRDQGWKSPRKHKKFNKDSNAHPLRDPSPRRGILIIIDGTPHDWFQNGLKQSLHLAIDDATGEVLCGWFCATECQLGYAHLLRLLVTKHGIPDNIYSDKHTILKSPKDGNLTQFGRMCDELGINMIFAETAQAKGKIEKMNDTIQGRLLNDIKRYNIKSVDQLNVWFNDFYCEYLNHKFDYEPAEKETEFISLEKGFDLSKILCLKDNRTILDGNCISVNNNYYIPVDSDENVVIMYKGTTVEIWEDIFTNEIKIFKNKNIYKTKMIAGHRKDTEKNKQQKINNQKELDEALRLRDERKKAMANNK